MTDFAGSMVDTPRLRQHVWTSGPDDGRPLLLVHGNITTGGFWRYVAERLPDDVRVIAPDLRSFGRTEPKPVDATRGLRDMADDLHDLLTTLGLSGRRDVHAAGWSMGGGVLQQYLIDHARDLASVTLIAPLSPYGFGGCRGPDGEPCTPDWAGTGAGTASPDFVRRLAARDASSDEPESAPREVLLTYFGPGTRGVMNSMSGKYYDTSVLGDLVSGPPITWLRGTADQVVSDRSMFDLATLGELGVVPGWPGAEMMPPQPMEGQLRGVLERYAGNGGRWREIVLEGVAHGIPLEGPDVVAAEIERPMADALSARCRGLGRKPQSGVLVGQRRPGARDPRDHLLVAHLAFRRCGAREPGVGSRPARPRPLQPAPRSGRHRAARRGLRRRYRRHRGDAASGGRPLDGRLRRHRACGQPARPRAGAGAGRRRPAVPARRRGGDAGGAPAHQAAPPVHVYPRGVPRLVPQPPGFRPRLDVRGRGVRRLRPPRRARPPRVRSH